MPASTVIDVLRRFLPEFLASRPGLSAPQRRAVAAIRQCRTPALGGHVHACPDCERMEFAWHSCNHKACPQCGCAATQAWVERQLDKLPGAPCFMVTFTLPQELRGLFFGSDARAAFDLFFAAAATALVGKLASPRWLGAQKSGFTAVLHTWNQRLLFHPHLHCIVPGAGLRADGRLRQVKNAGFLLPLPALRAAFKEAFRHGLERRHWDGAQVDPALWTKEWGVHIQPAGNGASAVKYLGAYVARTAISDARIVALTQEHVVFRWKDRAQGGRVRLLKLDGVEFVRRYLRHVLPRKMHSVRHYGFCHPAAKRSRERLRFLSGLPLILESSNAPAEKPPAGPRWSCPCCGAPMRLAGIVPRRAGRAFFPRPPPDSS